MLRLIVIYSVFIFVFSNCPARAQDADNKELSIVEVARQTDGLSTFVQALNAANLVGTLQDEGPFTVFAPTDEAFATLPDGTLESLLQTKNKENLQAILQYHVVPAAAMASDVIGMNTATTLQGQVVRIQVQDGTVKLVGQNSATVTRTDIQASNGVIHLIDRVLLPPQPVYPESLISKVSRDLQAFADQLRAPLFLRSASVFAEITESNIEEMASHVVANITHVRHDGEKYRVVPFGQLMDPSRHNALTQQLIFGEGFTTWDKDPISPGDYVVQANWGLDAQVDGGQGGFSYFVTADSEGVKFDPVRWLTPSKEKGSVELEKDMFWAGVQKNRLGQEVVRWNFSVEFVSVNRCRVRGISVERTVSAPGWGWHAESDTGYSTFCIRQSGCNCGRDGENPIKSRVVCRRHSARS